MCAIFPINHQALKPHTKKSRNWTWISDSLDWSQIDWMILKYCGHTYIYRYIPGYSLRILDIYLHSFMYLDKKTLVILSHSQNHQNNSPHDLVKKKSPTNLRAPGWHYFPIQLASRPQMGRRVEIDMGFPGVFKTQGSLGKGPRFFWLRRKFAQHVGFYGTSTVFNWQFLLETSIKIGVKSHFKTKKTSTLLHLPRFTFIPPKMSVRKSLHQKFLKTA